MIPFPGPNLPAAVETRPARPLPGKSTLAAAFSDLARGVLVRVEGEAGVTGLETLQIAFTQVLSRRPPLAVLDLSRLSFVSSLAIGQLVRLYRDLNRWNGRVRIVSCPPAIRQVLETAGVHAFFAFHESVEEAISAG
jgi:anti-anti-sigma factor